MPTRHDGTEITGDEQGFRQAPAADPRQFRMSEDQKFQRASEPVKMINTGEETVRFEIDSGNGVKQRYEVAPAQSVSVPRAYAEPRVASTDDREGHGSIIEDLAPTMALENSDKHKRWHAQRSGAKHEATQTGATKESMKVAAAADTRFHKDDLAQTDGKYSAEMANPNQDEKAKPKKADR